MDFDASVHPHRRLNPLTGEWVLVSPHRAERPWQGQVERAAIEIRPRYDPGCYLCPGNVRAGGERNPNYASTFVFTNDYAALLPETPTGQFAPNPLFHAQAEAGTCRVVCFSPRHDLTLPEMSVGEILGVVEVWAGQSAELGSQYRWVQVFENKGELMGCSNPHPHGQIWAGMSLPNEAAKEEARQKAFYEARGAPMLIDYLSEEARRGERVIVEDEHWLAVVPFWAIWPFEVLLIARRPVSRLTELEADERLALASVLKRLLTRYDNLFQIPFPYSMGWHGAPSDGNRHPHWQLHAHFYPPLLRSAEIKKFMVGYEMLAEPQRDLTPESAAGRLRAASEIHFRAPAGSADPGRR